MARVTVTDCLENVENRFQLVLLASKRARQIIRGATSLIPEQHDKPTVVALREIAEGFITAEMIAQIKMPIQLPDPVSYPNEKVDFSQEDISEDEITTSKSLSITTEHP